ncbi:proton-dependent oligopeptide transporter, POT family [Micromonospora pattaloongensis]|uniref:Proton-dependent oligopeptide transporter, POT family n=1 Tax=Micromonospora pattaloongensis TaxID=405436 RepID=A0A1H3P692_9ACTN|nr:peptide MFS transporter [Micromonospora pattaloongensis]SDY96591.1 proton-dependent oligopeptide transporter, POT family [Micromonospora pattaloongensis]
MSVTDAPAGAPGGDRQFFGHPRGLATLFLTEMWERFSFYGMRAILVLYLTAAASTGGLGMSVATASAVYGVYNAMVYLMALPGGWIADRLLGARRSVLWGGVVIAAGHYVMAIPTGWSVFAGMTLIVLGTGLLKPNISTMVGDLYDRDSPRRDAGFSLFYMGINIGGFLAPLITGYLGEKINWHLGFAAAAVGMTLAVIQYVVGGGHLGRAGVTPTDPLDGAERRRALTRIAVAVLVAALLVLVLAVTGLFTVNTVVNLLTALTVLITVVYFARILFDRRLAGVERDRMRAYLWLFVFAAAFWLIYDQAGSVLNVFAEDSTDRHLFGFTFPASWLQSANPILIIIAAPLFAALWVRLGHRLSTPVKFALGLVLNGLSFVLMAAAARAAVGGELVSPLWLIAVYAVQVCGELCLSPVGLSVTTKLAPARYASQMMGLWFLAVAVGDAIGGQVARLADKWAQPTYFLTFGLASVALGLGALMFTRHIRTLMSGIH